MGNYILNTQKRGLAMLQKKTVKKKTFELLKTMMNDEKLQQFQLVGGTALALYIGHRESIDLDLFSHQEFDVTDLEKYLNTTYGFVNEYPQNESELLLVGKINDVKVDCVKPVYSYGGIRIASINYI